MTFWPVIRLPMKQSAWPKSKNGWKIGNGRLEPGYVTITLRSFLKYGTDYPEFYQQRLSCPGLAGCGLTDGHRKRLHSFAQRNDYASGRLDADRKRRIEHLVYGPGRILRRARQCYRFSDSLLGGTERGHPFFRRCGKYILISHHDLERATLWFDKYGDWITFIARFLPAVRTFISLPAGIARMNLAKFSLYAFIGSFIWSAALAYGGYVLGQNWETLRNAMRPFDYPIVGLIIVAIIVFIWMRLKNRSHPLPANKYYQ